jgi:hypothetical protein
MFDASPNDPTTTTNLGFEISAKDSSVLLDYKQTQRRQTGSVEETFYSFQKYRET